MNIFTEIWTSKLPRRVIEWIQKPVDHERPQDDVPDETILRHLHADYRKMLRERLTLIQYIRKMENIYKNAQMGIFQMAVSEWTRKLIYINSYTKHGYHRMASVVNIKE